MSARDWIACAAALPVIAGCSASGLDAKSSFACQAPEGVTCMSLAGVYASSRSGALPGQQPTARSRNPGSDPSTTPSRLPAREPAEKPRSTSAAGLEPGAPLRSAPRVLRIWVAPYEDSDGDLRDQTHIYVTVDSGKWQVEHARRAIRDRFAPIRVVAPSGAPVAPASATRSAEGGAAAMQAPPALPERSDNVPSGSGTPRQEEQ